jgi:hypothetical protein
VLYTFTTDYNKIQYVQYIQASVSPGFAQQIMPYLLGTTALLDTWTVVHMTAAKFEPLIFSVWGLALSNITNIFIFINRSILLYTRMPCTCHAAIQWQSLNFWVRGSAMWIRSNTYILLVIIFYILRPFRITLLEFSAVPITEVNFERTNPY